MPLPLLALGLSTGLGVLKAGQGFGQSRKGERIRKRAQNEFDANPFKTPTEALQALSSAQNQAAQTRLPGQDLLEDKISGATGSAISAIKEAATTPQDIIGSTTAAFQNLQVDPLRDLAIAGANRFDANQRNLQSQLGNIAGFRAQEWQQNVLNPYQAAMGTAGQLAAAGQKNLFSGISDIAGGVGNFGLAGGFDRQDIDKSMTETGITADSITSPVSSGGSLSGDLAFSVPGFNPNFKNNNLPSTNNLIQYYG